MAQLRRASAELRGHVRITGTGFVLTHFLVPALDGFAQAHPGMTLELLPEGAALSFHRRETDIALRLGSDAEDNTRIRKLGCIPFRLYRPAGVANPVGVVRYGDELRHVPEMVALDRCRPQAHVALKASRLDILTEAALSLGAEVMLPERLAARDNRFESVDQADTRAERPLYLLIHPERARVPSVATVTAWIERAARGWF
jgi:DNA-binding transcriptional LysR family regulator